ncbi:hypothetical protein FRC11_010197, partial [Ceratobasidium sp. 423]
PQSATSLPTPITLMLTCLPAPSVLSFTSGHHVNHQLSSPYPPPTGDLPAPPNGMHHMNASSASVYTLSVALKELLNPAPTSRKYTSITISLPSPATSASGTAAVPSASLSPMNAQF